MAKIIATYKDCVQVGPDDFITKRVSRVFGEESTIKDMLEWGRKITGYSGFEFTSFEFSHLDEVE